MWSFPYLMLLFAGGNYDFAGFCCSSIMVFIAGYSRHTSYDMVQEIVSQGEYVVQESQPDGILPEYRAFCCFDATVESGDDSD